MASLNKYIATGHLCADPELRKAGDTPVASIRLAVDDSYKGRDGQKVDRAVFLDVEVWGKGAQIACQYLAKGSHIAIDGKLVMDSWDDKETGHKRTKLKVRASDFGGIVFLGRKGERTDAVADAQHARQAPAAPAIDEEIPF